MRVIAGSARGRPLRTLPGLEVRPTLDRVRQGVFSSLGERVRGAVVLDLFAGSGAVGIEALSRGASQATFVELSGRCARCLRGNLERCALVEMARILQCDWRAGVTRLRRGGEVFDLVYVDPPYGRFDELSVLQEVHPLLGPGAILLFEHLGRRTMPEAGVGFRLTRQMRYGQTSVSWYEPVDRVDSPHIGR